MVMRVNECCWLSKLKGRGIGSVQGITSERRLSLSTRKMYVAGDQGNDADSNNCNIKNTHDNKNNNSRLKVLGWLRMQD